MKLLSNQSECSFHCITVSKPVYTSDFKSLWSYIFPFTPHHLTFYIKHETFHFLPLFPPLFFFFFLCLRTRIEYRFSYSLNIRSRKDLNSTCTLNFSFKREKHLANEWIHESVFFGDYVIDLSHYYRYVAVFFFLSRSRRFSTATVFSLQKVRIARCRGKSENEG